MNRVREMYGRGPLHLLVALATLAIAGAGIAGWVEPGSDLRGTVAWALGCLLVPQAAILALGALVARLRRCTGDANGDRVRRRPGPGPPGWLAHLWVPTLLSVLLLLAFLPLILRFDAGTFAATSGILPTGYLARWLLATACLFAISCVVYVYRLVRGHARTGAAHCRGGT